MKKYMFTTTLSSQGLNQATGAAKKAANHGPVLITDHGRAAYVLLNIKDYEQIAGEQKSLSDALAQTHGGDLNFKPS